MVEEILKIGEPNALSNEYLVTKLKLNSIRELQKRIELERRNGAVILSTSVPPGGYFLPSNASEVRQFIRTLESRAENTLLVLDSARRYLADIEECATDAFLPLACESKKMTKNSYWEREEKQGEKQGDYR